jgi:hypothetical protein
VLAFPFWPFLLLQLVGAPGPLAALAAAAFLVIEMSVLAAPSPR